MSAATVLFDAPGPRGRRRIALASAAAVLVIVAVIVLVVVQFGRHGQLAGDRWSPFVHTGYLRFLAGGVRGTLIATGVGALLSFPLGVLAALGRLSHNRLVSRLATAYVEVFRSLPLLLLIYAFLLALPRYGLNLPVFWKLVVPLVMVNVAVLAEVVRAGVNAVDRGQSEAGWSIGLTYGQTMRHVVLPQALRIVIPALITGLVSLLKDTTLGYVVSYPELMKTATNLTAFTHLLIQTYLIITVLYVLVNVLLSQLAHHLERRMRTAPRGGGQAAEQLEHETHAATTTAVR